MNIVYTAFTATRDWLQLAEIMINSLIDNTSVDKIFAGIVTDNIDVEYKIGALGDKIRPFRIDADNWEKNRMAYKIELMRDLPIKEGDNVFVLDADIYVKKNIFEWFDSKPDVILTVRPEFFLSVNGGVWGFRYTGQGKVFLDFFIQQMQHPTWCKFKKFRIKDNHDQQGRDWWMDQDFLCVVNDFGLPFSCDIKKLHCRTHNCTPSKRGLESCMNNPDKSIVHFKGGLKPYWLAYYPKYMRRKSGK